MEREPIILSVGTIEPRKNTRGTVSAFIELKRRQPELPHRLICIGRPGWENDHSHLSTSGQNDIDMEGMGRRRGTAIALLSRSVARLPVLLRGIRIARSGSHESRLPRDHQQSFIAPRGRRATPRSASTLLTSTTFSSMQLLLNDGREWIRRSQAGLVAQSERSPGRGARERRLRLTSGSTGGDRDRGHDPNDLSLAAGLPYCRRGHFSPRAIE